MISDLGNANTQAWFGGQVQKIVSTSASLGAAKFNRLRPEEDTLALFDGRTHHLDGVEGVLEYVRWREADAMKNSVGMLAAHHFSHRVLTGVPVRERKAMLADKGFSWDGLDQAVRQGTFVRRVLTEEPVTYWHGNCTNSRRWTFSATSGRLLWALLRDPGVLGPGPVDTKQPSPRTVGLAVLCLNYRGSADVCHHVACRSVHMVRLGL